MRRVLLVLLVVAVGGLVWAAFVREVDEDPYDCGPVELPVPPTTTPNRPPPSIALEAVLDEASAVAAVERSDGRMLFLTRDGSLLQVDRPGGTPEVLLELDAVVRAESGGLGLALSPDERFLYLSYTPNEAEAELLEFPVTESGIDPSGRRTVTTEPNPRGRHLMANLVFGPDGLLYVGVGDRGNPPERAGEPSLVAQDLSDRGGKIWRIDPRPRGADPYSVPSDNPFQDRDDAAAEVFLYGFRNPWRFSFDRASGDLWIADAGEYCAEEITRLSAGDIAGANLGWNVYEGPLRFDASVEAPDAVAPLYSYPRGFGDEATGEPTRCAVIGGYVYRGEAIPDLQGAYVFGDFCTGMLEVLEVVDGAVVVEPLVELPEVALQALAEGRDGELYALTTNGVFALVPR